MTFTVSVQRGNRMSLRILEHLGVMTRRGIRQGFFRLGDDLVKEARRSIIKGPKTGRLYRIPGRRRRHRASAPGEPPANLSGALQKSIDYQIRGWDRMEFGSRPQMVNGQTRLSNTANYARAQELGNPKGNLAPRPFLAPAVDKMSRNARRHFRREIKASHRP